MYSFGCITDQQHQTMENLNESLLGIKIPVVCSTWIFFLIIILQFHNFLTLTIGWYRAVTSCSTCNSLLPKEKISWVAAEFTVISYFDVPPIFCLHTGSLPILYRIDVLTCIICDKKTGDILDSLICLYLPSLWPHCQEECPDKNLVVTVMRPN